jgi:hypothetical protein
VTLNDAAPIEPRRGRELAKARDSRRGTSPRRRFADEPGASAPEPEMVLSSASPDPQNEVIGAHPSTAPTSTSNGTPDRAAVVGITSPQAPLTVVEGLAKAEAATDRRVQVPLMPRKDLTCSATLMTARCHGG